MSAAKEVRKTCASCSYGWLDKYGKNECPKCLAPLTGAGSVASRAPGEASTFKRGAGDAMESSSGDCSKGGEHTWKFGKCGKCGQGEGYGKEKASPHGSVKPIPGGACEKDGKMHVFKFSKCTKCGKSELAK